MSIKTGPSGNRRYDDDYYQRYEMRGLLFRRGERPWLYSFWRRLLSAACADHKAKSRATRRLLEVGCGAGYGLRHFSRAFRAVGVDVAYSGLRLARARLGPAFPLVIGSAGNLPLRSSYFDAVAAFDILEHLDEPRLALNEIRRVLVDAGVLAITVPNPRSFGMRIKEKKWFGARDLPSIYRDKTHVSVLDRHQWRAVLEECGFEVLRSGSDWLWDIPYFRFIPTMVQRFLFSYPSAVLTALFGFARWQLGENLAFVARVRSRV